MATTHASWVFLIDNEAWKVKRPVDYGFLDYSDAEKRLRCCEEEVRLGARLAGDVYLGVVPIYRGRKGFSFQGPGEIVDHAVRMRRLPDEDSASALVAAGRLTAEHLDALAWQLAQLYAAAPVTPELGQPAVLLANMAENYAQTLQHFDRFLGGSVAEELYHWQQGLVFALERQLLARVTDGRSREGHGDLRLEHVYFPPNGSPLVIDPIEFNRRFRCADVALDAAFLAMELDAAGRPDLGAYFMSCLARATNDYGFYPLLDLYLSYRAWVRAKVACFVAADPSTPPEKARRKGAEASRLLALAASYRRAPRARPVIVVGGMIGAGKSTLADALSLALELPVVSSDATRKHLGGIDPWQPGESWLYAETFTRRTYRELRRRAGLVLESGRGVILDATFRDPAERQAIRRLAYRGGSPFLFLEVTCDEATVRARLRRREHERSISDAREGLLPRLRAQLSSATELPPAERLVLDGARSPEALVEQVQRAMHAPPFAARAASRARSG